MDVQDSPLRFLKRNLNVKRVTHLVKRGYNSIKNEGLEATQRKVQFRVNLMLKRMCGSSAAIFRSNVS